MTQLTDLAWWQRAVFYQIYPRSFADSDGDGVGDLAGIIAKLDYLADLGIDAIWLSPHYPSPQFDCGYDISDYTGVNPEYGTLDDLRRFLDGAHQRGIRVILDLVLNHTSDQHAWFLESRSSRDNPKRDWYIWRDGRDGGPPNDWLSTFGGPGWTYDPGTDQYYYHYFFGPQPDLNWRNPQVKQAMFDAVRFWLELGVDGFRLDAIGTIYEHPEMPDHGTGLTLVELRRAAHEAQTEEEKKAAGVLWMEVFGYQLDQPGVHDLMKELRALVDEYDDRMLVGETHDLAYHGDGSDELHMVFNFPLMWSDGPLTAGHVRANQAERLAALPAGAWPCNTLGNHDSPRVYSRYGDGEHDDELARLWLALVLTLPGTPFLYNGEEIGMVDLYLEDPAQLRDMLGTWAFHALQEEAGLTPEQALYFAVHNSRDRCRTPMQWSAGAQGGFSPAGVAPWLPVHPNHAAGVNVADQQADPHSLWRFYRAMLRLRKQTPALIAGDYAPLQADHPDRLVFVRQAAEQSCLVALNLSPRPGELALPAAGRVLFGTHRGAGDELAPAELPLAPFEILIVEL